MSVVPMEIKKDWILEDLPGRSERQIHNGRRDWEVCPFGLKTWNEGMIVNVLFQFSTHRWGCWQAYETVTRK